MEKKSFGSKLFRQLQRLGPAMMPVIAIMPIAGLMYGIGAILTEPTIVGLLPFLGNSFFATISSILFNVGNLITTNLHILFAICIAASFCKNDAVAGMSGGIAFLVLCKTLGVICNVTPEMVAEDWTLYTNVLGINTLSMGVLGGIISGCMVAWLFNKFKDIKLPQVISFFQGKRFIPIISIFGAIVIAIPLAYIWPTIQGAISAFGVLFVSVDNAWWVIPVMIICLRLLLIFGLHTLLFVPLAYQFGTWVNAAGEVFHGAYPIYFAQMAEGADLTTYAALAGNYTMIFSYLALGCAFICTARKERKTETKAQIIPSMVTVGLTGISEPLEYSYVFNCLPAYIAHSIIMAMSTALVTWFHFTVATGSWGGALDFLIYGILQNNPTWLKIFIVGPLAFIIEFVLMVFLIKKFNWKTPGRDENAIEESDNKIEVSEDRLPYNVLKAFGGKLNIKDIDACATRLRVSLVDSQKLDQAELKRLGAAGIVKVGESLQVIFGAKAILLKEQIIAIMEGRAINIETIEENIALDVEEDVVIPCDGELIELSKVNDKIFAEGMMGSGFAIIPSHGEIVSPINGKIVNIFPTKHAIAIVSDNGKEVLIHMGIDTVKLEGKPFEILVEPEQLVSTGTPIAKMDLSFIKESGHDSSVCVVFTNILDKKVSLVEKGNVKANTLGLINIVNK